MRIHRHGIRCNAVLPGYITTALSAALPKSRLDEVSTQIAENYDYMYNYVCFMCLVHEEDCTRKTRKT